MEKQVLELFQYSRNTYYVWKRQRRPIILLLEKYFSEQELQEFLDTGKISKLEKSKVCDELLTHYRSIYFDYIHNKMRSISNLHDHLLQYYFQYLYYIKGHTEQFGIHKRPFHAAAISFAMKFKNDFAQKEIDNFHLVFDLLDFMDDQPGMWNYFKYLLKNDLRDFIEGIDLRPYSRDGKIIDGSRELENLDSKDFDNLTDEQMDQIIKEAQDKDPTSVSGLDHYYLYHCYNNIAPYSINELEEDS